MGIAEYGELDALGMAELVRSRAVSAEELLAEALARVTRVNPQINAVVHMFPERARAAIAGGLPDGPFSGVPFLLKDLLAAFAGEPLRGGSRLFADLVPTRDSELVRRFKQAGLVIFGKTATPELGTSALTESALTGITRNPWNLNHTSGGSSGGTSAAVAARILPMASGGDGGGSIRTPAAATGLVGLKPSRGRNPSGPDGADGWWGFAVEHVLSRTVRDTAAALDVTAGDYPGQLMKLAPAEHPFLSEVGRAPGRLRIAFSTSAGLGTSLDPECRDAVQSVAARLASLGHEVEEVNLPLDGPAFVRDYLILLAADMAATVRWRQREIGRLAREDELEPRDWLMACLGEALSAGEVTDAYWRLQQFARDWLLWAEPFDLLLTSSLGMPPAPVGFGEPDAATRALISQLCALPKPELAAQVDMLVTAFQGAFNYSSQTMMANVTGQPGISLPLAWSRDGLPLGMMFTGRTGDESTLLRLAGQLEQEMPWRHRKPPLTADA